MLLYNPFALFFYEINNKLLRLYFQKLLKKGSCYLCKISERKDKKIMEVCIMSVEVRSVIIGLFLGFVIMLVCGAGKIAGTYIGYGVPAGGKVVVRAFNGEAFVIDVDTANAERVLFKKPEPGDPRYPNNINGRGLMLGD
jgi:hypothetical protein